MQGLFDFLSADILRWRDRLTGLVGADDLARRRAPIDQLVKSIISGRTLDAVSAAAFDRLKTRYPTPALLAAAAVPAIEAAIADVTFADGKAVWVAGTMARLRDQTDFALDFLGTAPLGEALAWLETLPGVGRKVAASTLNASTLNRPVMIVDTHVLRVLGRLGAVGGATSLHQASDMVTGAMPGWDGNDFLGFHVMLKRLGQRVCRTGPPLCGACPLAGECPTARPADGPIGSGFAAPRPGQDLAGMTR